MSELVAINKLLMDGLKPSHCDQHGHYESRSLFRNVWSRCPVCSANETKKQHHEDELKRRGEALVAWNKSLGHAAIPKRFIDRRLDEYKVDSIGQRKALTFAKHYADNFNEVLDTGRCAIFCGKPGTGKTHLAIGIGLQIMENDRRSVLFSTVSRAIRRVRDTWGSERVESTTAAFKAFEYPDLLILDEVGFQQGTESEAEILFSIINDRYESKKPTIMISNLDLDGVKTCLGERVFDRIREGGGEVVIFDWESMRGDVVA